jgi:excisionase family DNA binding protein
LIRRLYNKLHNKPRKAVINLVEAYKQIYTAKEAAKLLQINLNAIYDLMNSGQLPYLVLGSRRIRGTDLETFINTFPAEKGA